jgi:NAD(P)-dependent dehydrogenase (short-subunit alcohol dehydrogenase family)
MGIYFLPAKFKFAHDSAGLSRERLVGFDHIEIINTKACTVETEMIEDLVDNPKFLERIKMRLPSRRLATPDEFAGIAIYLMSELSKYHAGAAITIDGAYSIS